MQKWIKTSHNILMETQGGVESFSDQIWCLDSVSDFQKDLFYLTWAKGAYNDEKGDLNVEKIYAKK